MSYFWPHFRRYYCKHVWKLMVSLTPYYVVCVFYPSGHEYGITNVSSHGRVNITVIPPNKLGKQLSPAPAHSSSTDSSYTTQHQRYYSDSSSPRSPPVASSAYNGNNSNNISRSSHQTTTVHSNAEYKPRINGGEQLLQPAAPTQPSGEGL